MPSQRHSQPPSVAQFWPAACPSLWPPCCLKPGCLMLSMQMMSAAGVKQSSINPGILNKSWLLPNLCQILLTPFKSTLGFWLCSRSSLGPWLAASVSTAELGRLILNEIWWWFLRLESRVILFPLLSLLCVGISILRNSNKTSPCFHRFHLVAEGHF